MLPRHYVMLIAVLLIGYVLGIYYPSMGASAIGKVQAAV